MMGNRMLIDILIVEDDKTLREGLERALSLADRRIEGCGTLSHARRILRNRGIDLLILDINLPDGSGIDFLEELGSERNFPIIVLTANDMEVDIVAGLEAGADDHITKPFSLAVLRARVNTQLRKKIDANQEAGWVSGKYRFLFDRMEYYVEGWEIQLSKNEQKLLRMLVENEGSILKRELLIDRIWTDSLEYVDGNALSVTIKRLRDKLHAEDQIETIYGIGYRWVKTHG